MSETPRVHVIDMKLKPGESFHITPFSDLHIDDSLCDIAALKKVANERRGLERHFAVAIGDVLNLVVPTDLKRYRPSVQPAGIAGRDDWVNATVSYVSGVLKELDLNWLLISPGNHEDEFTKRTGVDLTSLLARDLGCFRGGYSGVVDFSIKGKVRGDNTRFRLAYHHGAWGGRTNKGYSGAWPWFSQIDSWNVAIYGHNHASRVDHEVRRRPHRERLIEYPVYLVNCGSFVQSYADDAKQTHYAERHGYLPQPRRVPLIKVTVLPGNGAAERRGEYVPKLAYTVTV